VASRAAAEVDAGFFGAADLDVACCFTGEDAPFDVA
jgi:hypothetical protein